MDTDIFYLDTSYRLRTSPQLLKFSTFRKDTNILANLFLLIAGLGFFWILVQTTGFLANQNAVPKIETIGTIVSCTLNPAQGRGMARLAVVLNYNLSDGTRIEGREVSTVDSLNWSNCDKFISGLQVKLTYSPTYPTLPRIIDERFSRPWYARLDLVFMFSCLWLVDIGLIILSIVSTIASIRARLDFERLVNQSGRVKGEITKIEGVYERIGRYGDRSNFVVTLNYKIKTPTGAEVSGTARAIRNDLSPEMLPKIGTPVMVQYASERIYCVL